MRHSMTSSLSPLFMGRNRKFLEEAGSTNTMLQEWQREQQLPEGTLLYTSHQTAGKGQAGNSWQSKPYQNFTGSFLLYPRFLRVKEQFWLSKAVALAVQQALQRICWAEEVRIKWPNDILVNGRKVSGILIENTLSESGIRSSVVGIGINVLQTHFDSPLAGSIYSLTGIKTSPDEVLENLAGCLEQQYLQLRARSLAQLDYQYHQVLQGLGKHLRFRAGEEIFSAVPLRVEADGALVLSDETGSERKFYLKEIQWLWD